MKQNFKVNAICLALCLAFPPGQAVHAQDAYPALPVALSSSVQPNVLLHIDNSGSMADRPNGKTSGDVKMVIAQRVATNLINQNKKVRWGIFSFHPSSSGTPTRHETGGILQQPIANFDGTATTDGPHITAVKDAINGLTAFTWTPLAETLYEMGRYWAGQTSYYGKTSNAPLGQYTSPIQYRCQKNFNIVVTDGESTKDNWLPGNSTYSNDSYYSWDDSGNPVSKSFGICTSASTISSVSCPATLEGASTTSGFGTTAERTRAVRDISAFLFDKDMRYGLATTDADGKSWDDPKFRKQNVVTYTVGFDTNNDVLRATAIAGRGAYYTASDEVQLTAALNSVVSSIIDSASNAGGVSPASTTATGSNKLFQPLFNPKGWYGELKCLNLDMATGVATGPCSPNGSASIPAASSRKIFSAKLVGDVTTPFPFNDSTGFAAMTAQQKSDLGTTDDARKKVINFIRGSVIAGFRSRPNGLLGDIVDGQPLVVGKPDGQTPDADYAPFKVLHSARSLVFVGANDGMLHGFKTSDMNEFFGFVPSPGYPKLARLTNTAYGESSSYPHSYFVNGALKQQDVKLSTGWSTLLVGGLAQGGQGYFALDASSETKLTASDASAVKWEFTDKRDANLGYTFGAPIIYNVRTSATTAVPAVVLSNGYESVYADGMPAAANTSTLYVVKAEDGTLIKKLTASSGAGLSSPAGVDFGQDGVLDYVYAGDASGKLWRFDLTGNTADSWTVSGVPIFDAGSSQPITMRPAIQAINSSSGASLGNLVIFGTGRLLTEGDRSDVSVQSMYAVLDDLTSTTISKDDLVERTIEGTGTVALDSSYQSGTYRKISRLPELDLSSTTNTKKGWFLDFPDSSERLVTAPFLLSDKLLFGTGIPVSSEKCAPGKGWLMGVNPKTGSVTLSSRNQEFSFMDVKLDNRSTDLDKVAFSSGSAFASGYAVDGIPTEVSFVSKTRTISTVSSVGGDLGNAGAAIALGEANAMAVYTGNAATGVSAGNAIGRDKPSGDGFIYVPVVGNTSVGGPFKSLTPSGGVKVETAIWREIK